MKSKSALNAHILGVKRIVHFPESRNTPKSHRLRGIAKIPCF